MAIKTPSKRWASLWITGVALLLLVIGGTLGASPAFAAGNGSGRVTLHGHLVPALKHIQARGSTAGAKELQMDIALNPRNASGLKALIAQQSDKTSSLYHHYLTPAEYNNLFAPTQATVNTVEAFLSSQGLRIGTVSSNRLFIHADGSVSAIEHAFQTHIADYNYQGRTVYAPTAEPSVPSALAGMVVNVGGLNNVGVFHPMRGTSTVSPGKGGTGPKVISPNDGSFYGDYTPSDLRTAYNMNSLTNSYTGSGLTVGIFELDGYVPGDINEYLSYFGLGSPKYSNVLVDGATNTAGAGAIEVELDMEVVSAIAPGANQKIYIGPNTWSGVNDTYNKMVTDNVAKVNSSSWGLCEAYSGTSELQALDNIFAQGASQGQTFFAASGDSGAYDCEDTNLGVDSPASDPHVVGVGGTNLQTDSSQNYVSESVWSCPSCSGRGPYGTSGGGGLSSYFVMPTYQVGPGVVQSASTGYREVPDVSADADPDTGYAIYCTASAAGCPTSGCPDNCWIAVGGTSAAAPLWAGVATDINQYLAAQSKPTLGFASPMLYQLFNTPQTYSAYHDVTSGDNLYYAATSGYDLASGIGTPNVWNLARDAAANSPARSVSKTWYFAEGYTGGSFTEFLTLENPNSGAAHVAVQYLLQGKSPITKNYTLNGNSRQTLNVNTELGQAVSVSLVVTSDLPIVAERPMYFTFTGLSGYTIPGGSDVLGATTLGTRFDFGYLDTSAGHATYLTILNQNSSSITATVDYYAAAGGAPTTIYHTIAAKSRGTINVNAEGLAAGSYSALVSLSAPGLVERPMYLVDSVTGFTGSADVIGVPAEQTHWYFAEGFTSATTFNERYILFNPNGSTASAAVTFLKSDGSTVTANVSLGPGEQKVVSVNSVLGNGYNNSATVSATLPILAERFMSFKYGSSAIQGATDVIGAATPGYIFYFAEGFTSSNFSEYLTLENPDATKTAYVLVKYLAISGGAVTMRILSIPPHSRATVNTSTVMTGSFSMIVQSGLPIVAERPMYFNYKGIGQTGGTDVIGYQP